jgi:predicted DCC family thiol-disulfide oxidoreductase YuxK
MMTLLYDGQCPFCRAQLARLKRWDPRGRVELLDLHHPSAARRFPGLRHRDLMDEMHIVDRRGRVFRGVEAYRLLSRRLPRLWILAPLLHLPFSLPLWRWIYRKVARNRYLLGGAGCTVEGHCDAPPKELPSRPRAASHLPDRARRS